MDAPWKLAFAFVVPVAALTAWVTAGAVGSAPPGQGEESGRDLAERVARLEQALESPRADQSRSIRALQQRLDALEGRLAAQASSSATSGGSDSTSAAPPAGAIGAAEQALREEVSVGLMGAPTTGTHGAALLRLADHLVKQAGPPFAEAGFAWAQRRLLIESHRGRVTADEAATLEPLLFDLPVGHVARPPLARAVAIGWGRDERLAGLLRRFDSNAEPSLHQGVLRVLDDEHPGAAFSEYVLRLLREERDASVLGMALDLDIIEAAATAAVAPSLVQAIEARILDGGFEADTRSGAGLALSVASLRVPDVGVAALRRLADRETVVDIAERYRRAAAQLEAGNATLKSLERLFG